MNIIEIPADVRDNSETVTDYAFMRNLVRKGWAYHTVDERHREIKRVTLFPQLSLKHYQWHDVNPDGQRCRFDMVVNSGGRVVNLFHTEYFTRVPCAECEHSYASVYQFLTEEIDDEILDAVPRCDHHADRFRRLCAREGTELLESEPLFIGQH